MQPYKKENTFLPDPNSPSYKENHKLLFLKEYLQYGTISTTCKAINIDRATVFRWRRSDPAFEEAFQNLNQSVTDELESSAIQRAKDGDTVLTIFLLKSRDPYKFNPNTNKIDPKIIDDICSSLVGILRQHIPNYCPSCNYHLNSTEKVAEALKAVSKKVE